MKIFSLLIFSSLIAFILNLYREECNPSYQYGFVSLSTCSRLGKKYDFDECCMINYTDEEDNVYNVCVEFDAKMLTHYEQYKSGIKTFIRSYYPLHPRVKTLNHLYCSSKYIKFSFLALLLVLL